MSKKFRGRKRKVRPPYADEVAGLCRLVGAEVGDNCSIVATREHGLINLAVHSPRGVREKLVVPERVRGVLNGHGSELAEYAGFTVSPTTLSWGGNWPIYY